jgi:hypothetical protein
MRNSITKRNNKTKLKNISTKKKSKKTVKFSTIKTNPRKKNKKSVNKKSVNKKTRKKTIEEPSIKIEVPEIILEVENLPTKEKKVKKAPIMYFTQDTEDAVIEYNKEEDADKRNTLYNERIKYSFEKLVENIFNTFKFTYFETSPLEIQKETVAHLVANLNKYQQDKGKAFGYFSIVAKHYLIFHNNNNYKRFKQNVDISDTPSETTVCLQVEDSYYKSVEMSEFMKMMIDYWEKYIGKIFTKQKDLNIANAVIELFRNSDRIDAFNKKALYLYIREISSCKTQQITKVINKMKQYQNNITKSYINNGVLQKKPYKV